MITIIFLLIVFSAFIVTDINFAIILYNQYKMPQYTLDGHISVIGNDPERPQVQQLGERPNPEEHKCKLVVPVLFPSLTYLFLLK